jgi:hypothetical protein
MRHVAIDVPAQSIREFCEKNRILKLSLFGSVLRGDFARESDVDVLVEFAPDARVGLIRFAGIENALTDLLGRRVDLNTVESLSRYFHDEVLAEAETIYDATQ